MTEAYPEEQIQGLLRLLSWLCAALPNLRFITGHQDIDLRKVPASDQPAVLVQRKMDPGPLFPWDRVLEQVPLQRPSPADALGSGPSKM